ncbi:MAG: hypothetical protein K2M88_04905 [Muribaculaceae bacterium]|nr:hypothetical protein [Muribaculaceae bacterium]
MNFRKYIYPVGMMLGAAAISGALTGCQDSFDEPALEVPQATLIPNTTLAEFKAEFGDEVAVLTPYKDGETETPYILKGRVISSDASGNIYKSLVIQDETGALAFSINQSSMYVDYRLGQEVVINATDLWMGQYNSLLQMGWLGQYNGTPQITFMAYDIFNNHTEKNGLPNQDFKTINFGDPTPADNAYITRISLQDLNSIVADSEEYFQIMSQLVEIPNVSFEDAGQTPAVTFATYQNTEDRYICDTSGQRLNVRCSGYSSFWNDPLPDGIGTIRGILSRYGSDWQLMLRGIEDVDFSTKGMRNDPFTVEEAIALDNSGRNAWVEGYIIGSVASGVATVTSLSDINFTADATDLDNNLVIAPTQDCRNIEEMMVVDLPANTKIRRYANLLDNPEVLGHKLNVVGNLTEYLGMHGITGIADGLSVFTIEGINVGGLDGLGTGSESDPFKPSYIVKVGEALSDAWVEGYIVGFVEGRTYEKGANFSNDFVDKNFGGNNFILGDTKDTNTVENAIPVNLTGSTFRDQMDLLQHPELYGKKVLIRCNVASGVLGTFGISAISEIKIID